MPSAHRRHAQWTPARLLQEAAGIGPAAVALCEAIMTARPHPEQGFRTCLGILALARTYGPARLEAACARGSSIRARSVASIRSILQNGLDRAFREDAADRRAPPSHGNTLTLAWERWRGTLPLTHSASQLSSSLTP